MDIRVSEVIAAFAVLLTGAFLLFSLIIAVFPAEPDLPQAVLYPGYLFFSSFSYISLYIPVYFIVCSFLLVSASDYRRVAGFLSVLHIPAVTVSLALRTVTEADLHPYLLSLAELFGSRRYAFLVLVLTSVVELLIILRIFLESKPRVTERGITPVDSGEMTYSLYYEQKEHDGDSGIESSRDEYDDFDIPDMPDLPPFRNGVENERQFRLSRDAQGALKVETLEEGPGREIIEESEEDDEDIKDASAVIEDAVDEAEDDLLELDSLLEEDDEVDTLDDLKPSHSPEISNPPGLNTPVRSGSEGPVTSENVYIEEGEPGANKDLYESGEEVESLVKNILDGNYEYEEEDSDEEDIESLEEVDELEEAEEIGDLEEAEEESLEVMEELGEADIEDLEEVTAEDVESEMSDSDYYVPSLKTDDPELEIPEDIDGTDLPDDMELSLEYDEDHGDEEDTATALDPESIVIDESELEAHASADDEYDVEEFEEYMDDEDLLESGMDSNFLQGDLLEDEEDGEEEKKKTARNNSYEVPVDTLLNSYGDEKYWIVDEATTEAGETLRRTLEEFKIEAEVTGIRRGPVITMYEILPAPGVKLSKITNLADNIALRLAASSVRIVAPIPGKHAVGIEVPNQDRAIVSFHEMINDPKFTKMNSEIPVILGKDITGESRIIDLVQTPHLLIAGATGSGKSVCVNSLISSILCSKTPEEVKLMLIDPKIVELKLYNDIPHLLTPVITEPKKAYQALQYCLYEMERRYSLLDSQGVRDIKSYNKKIRLKRLATQKLPYIVVIVDEFADLMATTGKELESVLARLAAMARAVGIHLVLATQRPSIDVITGLIKANIPSRIAFMVAGKFDSRIILDAVGAEKLLGKGDMLFTSAWDPAPTRIQGSFLSEDEVVRIVEHVKTLGEPEYIDDEIFFDDDDPDSPYVGDSADDPLMDKAIEIVTSAGKASASYLQRRLKIGYNRAARMVEDMEARGIVGPQNGSKPREILHIPN